MWILITILILSSVLSFLKAMAYVRARARFYHVVCFSFLLQPRSCQRELAVLLDRNGCGWWDLFREWLIRKELFLLCVCSWAGHGCSSAVSIITAIHNLSYNMRGILGLPFIKGLLSLIFSFLSLGFLLYSRWYSNTWLARDPKELMFWLECGMQ